MSQSPIPEPTPSCTDSVADVMYQLPVELYEGESFAKCNKCEVVTLQQFKKVIPLGEDGTSPLELLKLSKRLILCTHCGTLRLTN